MQKCCCLNWTYYIHFAIVQKLRQLLSQARGVGVFPIIQDMSRLLKRIYHRITWGTCITRDKKKNRWKEGKSLWKGSKMPWHSQDTVLRNPFPYYGKGDYYLCAYVESDELRLHGDTVHFSNQAVYLQVHHCKPHLAAVVSFLAQLVSCV